MPKNFNLSRFREGGSGGIAMLLLMVCGLLVAANLVALYLFFFPPGGSRIELSQQRQQLRAQIAGARTTTLGLRNKSGNVGLGSKEASEFESKYFLPERQAYDRVIAEVQRMATASGIQEREAVYSKEPIEGSDDLSVLNMAGRFQGTYDNFMKFLQEVDHSPMLLMLDTVQATPQSKNGQIDAEMRFQAIIQEETAPVGNASMQGGQP